MCGGKLTWYFFILCVLSLHVNSSLSRLFQQADELEHRFISEPELDLRTVGQASFRGGSDLKRKIVGSECGLLESC